MDMLDAESKFKIWLNNINRCLICITICEEDPVKRMQNRS
jgi:hypothetical protein